LLYSADPFPQFPWWQQFSKKKAGNPNPKASRTFDRMDFLSFVMKKIAVSCPKI
jgi:hypothetical protein